MNEQFTIFFHGPFSQWYCASRGLRIEIDGTSYNCAEQYMMAQKALLFGDKEYYKKIMDAFRPREQKDYGRKVWRFDQEKWNAAKEDIVFVANMAKFSQHKSLRNILIATRGTTLIEANPNDRVWGVGLTESSPLITERRNWKGQNLLGQILTDVRDILVEYDWVYILRGGQ